MFIHLVIIIFFFFYRNVCPVSYFPPSFASNCYWKFFLIGYFVQLWISIVMCPLLEYVVVNVVRVSGSVHDVCAHM